MITVAPSWQLCVANFIHVPYWDSQLPHDANRAYGVKKILPRLQTQDDHTRTQLAAVCCKLEHMYILPDRQHSLDLKYVP